MIEIKLNFVSAAAAVAFLSSAKLDGALLDPSAVAQGALVSDTAGIPTTKDIKPPKPAKTEAAAPSPSTASPAPTPPADAAPATPKIEYAPLGEAITKLVAAGKAGELKALFATLKPIDGVEAVKKGSQVHADDLGKLKAGLEALEATADAMS